MFDVGWSELTLLGVVALVVIGPKDLPKVLRSVGSYTRKARSIAREFQNSVEDMLREAELEDVKKSLDVARNFDLNSQINKTIDPDGSLREHLAPPVLPAVTLDQTPPPPRHDAGSPETLPAPTIHTPIGSEPSRQSPAGLDPHPAPVSLPGTPAHVAAPAAMEPHVAAPATIEPHAAGSAAMDPHAAGSAAMDPHAADPHQAPAP